MTTTVQLRNLTGAAVSFGNTSLAIEGLNNNQEIAASATLNCFSKPEDVWQDNVLRTTVNANQVEVIMGGVAVPKATSLAFFDQNWNAQSLKPFRRFTTAAGNICTIADTLIYADVAAAGGAQAIALPTTSNLLIGKQIEIYHETAGALTVTGAGNQINISGTNSATLVSRTVKALLRFVWNGTVWLFTSAEANYTIHFKGRIYQERVIIAAPLPNGNLNDWTLLTTTAPNDSYFTIATAGNTLITGLINPDINTPREIRFLMIGAGNITFSNNSGSSAANNRFSIGANITITSNSFPMPTFTYNNGVGKVWTK